jgi:hypothetical protein
MTIYYRAGYKYVTSRKYEIQTPIKPPKAIKHDFYALYKNGKLVLEKGFAWDGVTGAPDYLRAMSPSAEHDALCQMMRNKTLDYDTWQDKVNEFFRDRLIQNGTWGIRAALWYSAVEFANAGHPDQGESNPIQEAP